MIHDRVQYFALHEAGMGPIVCANIHAPHKRSHQHDLLLAVQKFTASFGRRRLLIGDFNSTLEEPPASELVASGEFEIMDPPDVLDVPTSRPSGERQGRHIDYGFACPSLCVVERQQWAGPADHDTICYSLPMLRRQHTYVMSKPRQIQQKLVDSGPNEADDTDNKLQHQDVINNVDFQQDAAQWRDTFENHQRSADTSAMWHLLSACAERLLGAPDCGPRRTDEPSVIVKRDHCHKVANLNSAAMARLLKLKRLKKQFNCRPGDAQVRRSLERRAAALGEHCPSIASMPWQSEQWDDELQELIDIRTKEEQARRIQAWQLRMESEDFLRQWVQREESCEDVTVLDDAIHPQDVVSKEHEKFAALFAEQPPDACLVYPWMDVAHIVSVEGAPEMPRIDVTGERLMKRCHRQRRLLASTLGGPPI